MRDEKYDEVKEMLFESKCEDGWSNYVIEFGEKGDRKDLDDVLFNLNKYDINIKELESKNKTR
mgnify:CR=1 FL=1